MVAPRKSKKIFCTVIRVSTADDNAMRANYQRPNIQRHRNSRFDNLAVTVPAVSRPSDLLPWADPYIARLVTKLQEEVRDERAQSQVVSRITGACLAELEPPCPSTENDWEWQDEPRWSAHEDK
jgi:hypothetical protein